MASKKPAPRKERVKRWPATAPATVAGAMKSALDWPAGGGMQVRDVPGCCGAIHLYDFCGYHRETVLQQVIQKLKRVGLDSQMRVGTGLITAVLTTDQKTARDVLKYLGFKEGSKAKNPNTSNTVVAYSVGRSTLARRLRSALRRHAADSVGR